MQYHNIRKLAARNESIREEECARIAHEIHDELGQYLTVLRMQISLLEIKYGDENPSLIDHVESMKEQVDKMIAAVRDISNRLWPSIINYGLIPAMKWLLDKYCQASGLICRLHVAEGEKFNLPIELITAIFRILQGSLTNIVRHAEAKSVDVTIAKSGNELLLAIQDDGKGFDPQAEGKKENFGFLSMRERAMRWGGSISIDASIGNGVRIEIRMPINPEQT